MLETLIFLLQSIIHEQGDSFKFNKDLDKFFEDYIKKQIEQIDDCLKDINKKWFGFSWREDYGKILKQYYPSNYIPLSHNNKLYNNFGKIRYKMTIT